MNTAEPYLALQCWNVGLGEQQMHNVDLARREEAPSDAIYRSHDGSWKRATDLKLDHPFHAVYARFVETKKGL